MTGKLAPDYYSIKQLCEEWSFDLNQLQQAIEKHKIRLWICIKNKKRPFDKQSIAVRECEINTLTNDELMRLSQLSLNQLKSKGFTKATKRLSYYK